MEKGISFPLHNPSLPVEKKEPRISQIHTDEDWDVVLWDVVVLAKSFTAEWSGAT